MSRRRAAPLLLLALALAVRLWGTRWGPGLLFHPDERRIAEAVGEISFSPLRLDPKFYAYGSLPFYATRVAMAAARPLGARQDFEGAILAGRVLSALWGAAGVLALWALGRRLYGERVAARAALFWAIAVLPVQNAHFGTNDTALATLAVLALLLLVEASRSGRAFLFAAAGAAFGLALATKASALPLAAALVPALAGNRAREAVRRAALFAAAAAAAFAAGEPYALLHAPEFLRQTLEQAGIVRTAGAVPYTIQYVGTLPYLYPLKELVLWGLGPLLGLAAVWGTLRAVRGSWRGGAGIVLAFLVPFVLITGGFGVKFPRYLLPAYPLLLLFGAAALEALPGRGGRLVRGAVLAGSAAYLAAFLGIYAREHTVRTAARRCEENLPAGARLLGATWEEGFPGPYRHEEFPFYDPDSPAKTRALAAALADADAAVFPTKRIYGAVLQDPERFPDTARAFRLLFSGELGYEMVADVASRPRLLGTSLPDELADESFTVYDHPRVFVFANRARLPAAELEKRLVTFTPRRVLTRREVLLGAPPEFVSNALPDRGVRSSLPALALMALLAAALAIPGAALARAALGEAPGVLALSPLVGVTLFGWLAFLLASAGVPFTRGPLLALAALLVACGAWLARRLPRRNPRGHREAVLTGAVLLGSYLLFALLRAAKPEIFWGEKPMDFSFVNALERSVSLPPPEPWFSGSALHYTYFGHFTLVALGKALGVAPGLLFNLGVALTASLFAGALLFAGSAVAGSLTGGGGAVLLGLFAGNLTGVVELVRRRVLDFDFFWAVSRVVPSGINEFPFWSFVFADLHAHVLALPLAAAAAGILAGFTRTPARPSALALLALLLGALAATNGWSVPAFAGLTLLLSAAGALAEAGSLPARLARGIGRALLVGLGAWGAFLPFWSAWQGPPSNRGWQHDAFARPHETLLVFGAFVVLLLPLLATGLRALVRTRAGAWALAALLVLLALVSVTSFPPAEAPSSRPLAAVLVLLLAYAALLDERVRPAALLASAAFGLVLVSEFVFFWDRMNTVFKLWMDAWVLLAVACGVLAAEALARVRRRPLGALAIAAALATSALALAAWAGSRHVEGPRGTLDGTAYLERHAPDEAAAMRWLDANVRGLPTLVEACGPSYQEFTRVSMNTGLPVVLGWEYHVFQRAQDAAAAEERREDVARIYRATDPAAARRLLARWGVDYVFSGIQEEKAYGPGVTARLERLAPALTPVFRRGDVAVFRVSR